MTVMYGSSQTVAQQVASDVSGGYGSTLLSSTSGTYTTVGAVTTTFANCKDGMKLYLVARCLVAGDTTSVVSTILRINDNGTLTDLAETEAQSNLLATPVNTGQIVTLVGSYTVAHCGTADGANVTVSLMGRRVIGSNPVLVLGPAALQARLARD